MADGTRIEWTDATWNPIRGCSRVSAGCRHCYAELFATRFGGEGQPYEGLTDHGRWNGTVRLVESALDQPLRWKRPRRIFVNSMSDLFHESLALEDVLRIFEVMVRAEHHTFQVLTKRPKRVHDFVRTYGLAPVGPRGETGSGSRWPANVWLGVSVENQAAADERIPLLLETPAAVRFISCEPLLGPVDLRNVNPLKMDAADSPVLIDALTGHVKGPDDMLDAKIDWVIVGGESGPSARPMHPAWARSLRDHCSAAGVPFFFKQWGEWMPIDFEIPASLGEQRRECWLEHQGDRAHLFRGGKYLAGAELDGSEHKAFPEVANG